jgi:hypothetical protein
VGHVIYFVTGKNNKGGYRPICKACWNKRLRKSRGMPPAGWTPRFGIKNKIKIVETPVKIKKIKGLKITEAGLDILIQNGYARNREEAKRYLQC